MLSVQYVCNSTEENNPVFLETTMPSRNEVHHNFLKIIQIQIEGQTWFSSVLANHEGKTFRPQGLGLLWGMTPCKYLSNVSKPGFPGKKPRGNTPCYTQNKILC